MTSQNYTVYHLHTDNSLLDSCTKYPAYIDRAVELGQTAIAFTEHGNIYNWVEKKMYCDKKGIKYIHGIEIYLTETLEEKIRDNYHTILLAKNYDGVKEINELISVMTDKDHMYYKPRLTFDEFFNISNNVIKISACLASPLRRFPNEMIDSVKKQVEVLEKEKEDKLKELNAMSKDTDLEEEWIHSYDNADYDHGVPWAWRCEPHQAWLEALSAKAKSYIQEIDEKIEEVKTATNNSKRLIYKKLLKAYDYYEIQPHIKSLEQIKYNQMLYEASRRYNIPLIVGTDTHSLNKYKAECRSILQKAKRIEFANEDEFDLTYKSYDELVEMFKLQNSLPMDIVLDAIENTNRMADSVESFTLDTSIKYPKLYDDEEEVLKKRIAKMLKEKLDKGIIAKKDLPKYKANIMEEMRVFKKINMVGFMLFMSELVCWCWDNGIPIGFCRGSVGGSTIAFITDIIDVDPVKFDTIFSRFANEDREEVGDIDIDIAPDQRDLVYQHIIDSFGYDKTAYILAMGTCADKGAIDDIGRALEIPLDEVAQIKTLYSTYKDSIDSCNKRIKEIEDLVEFEDIKNADLKTLKSNYESNSDDENLKMLFTLKTEYQNKKKELQNNQSAMDNLQNNQYKELFYYFPGINGTTLSQSYHPAGIVVSPITIPDNFGTFWDKDGKRIICINMEEIHDGAGLVKYDLLALKNIQIIRKTCEYAGIPYPKSHEINWNDKDVWNDIITSPAGVFQFESPFAFQMLQDYKPQCINDLSIVNASLRPSGASYRDRLLAREPNYNPSKLIDDLLADNNGYLIFQEDTIKFLQNICGLSGSQADNVRRAIGRKQLDRLQAALPQILEGYCKMSPQPREVAEEEAKQFLKIIEDSASYQFGFNHSTGYSMIGYTCAYYRYYYPEEFTAAYLNCGSNTDDLLNGTELARVKGITIHSIKFGKSTSGYAIDKENHALYKGLESIKFLNSQIADELFELSKNHYSNFVELLADINTKTSVNSRQLTILIGLNFFEQFGKNKYLLDLTELYNKFAKCKQIKKDKMEELGVSEYLMKKYTATETAKMYKDIDNVGLVNEMASRLDNKSLSVVEQVKFEKLYLEYVIYTNPKINEQYYIVTDFKTYKDTSRPYLLLHNIRSGEDVKTKIKQGKIYKEQPFGEYAILKIKEFKYYSKTKCINGQWIKCEDDLEPIVDSYELIQ